MAYVPINLGVQSRQDRSDNCARLINCFAENAGRGGKVQYPIYADYGLQRDLVLPYGAAIRGALTVRDDALGVEFLYVVSGNNLFKVATDGTYDLLPISIASGRLTMARNGKLPYPEIAICVDGLAYLIQTDLEGDGDTYGLISDVDLPAPNSVSEIGGYFVFTTENGLIHISGINDGASYDALAFDAADVRPDGILVSKRISEGRLLIFGGESIETWRHTGDADFPLERDIGTTTEFGTYSPDSIASVKGVVGFVDSYGAVQLVTPAGFQQISTQTINKAISEVDKSTITGTAYSVEGQQFYCISSANWTWKYNLSTGLWHEGKSYGLERWRGGVSVIFNDKTLVCDYADSRIYELKSDYYKEDDSHMILEIITPDQQSFPNRYEVNELRLDVLVGVGLNSTDTEDYEPEVMVQYSDDSGSTWSPERTIKLGRIGQTEKRVRKFRWGVCDTGARCWRFRVSAAVAKGFKQAQADIKALAA